MNPAVWNDWLRERLPDWRLFRSMAWLCMAAIVLAVPVALDPVNVTGNPAVMTKVLVLRLLESIWAVALVLAWTAGAPVRFFRREFGPPMVALAVWGISRLVASLLSGQAGWTLAEAGHLIALPLLAWGTLTLGLPAVARLHTVVVAAALGGFLCAVYGFMGMTGWDPLRSVYPFVYATDDARNFLHSFLGNPEYFGGYAAALAAGAAGYGLYGPNRLIPRIAAGGFGLLMAGCVVLSGTRAALLVLAAVGGLLLARRWRGLTSLARKRILGVAAISVGLGLVGIVILSTENPLNVRGMRLAQRFASLGDPNSASVKERILFYAIAAETTGREPLLGSGPGSYQLEFYPRLLDMDERDERGVIARLMYDLRNRVAENAHSDWLQAWSEGGILGGIAFAFLGAALIGRFLIWSARISPREGSESNTPSIPRLSALTGVAAGAFGAALCLYLNSAFSFPLHMAARASLFFCLYAVFVGSAKNLDEKGNTEH